MTPRESRAIAADTERERRLEIIPPPAQNSDDSLRLLSCLDEVLRSKIARDHIYSVTDGSVRPIQGDRFEVFVEARTKLSTCFDWICRQVLNQECLRGRYSTPDLIKEAILKYAERQARRDSRITEVHMLGNFSILVNYGPVKSQFPHIDLQYPNHQFGLILTDKSPGTIVYAHPFTIETVSALQQSAFRDLPNSLAEKMERQPQLRHLLRNFGNVLSPDIRTVATPRQLTTGTVCSLPGSVIHAGPPCSKFRAILFFSGWPMDNGLIAEYNPDTQYFFPLLLCDMTNILWDHIEVPDRVYLLTKLADSMNASRYKNLFRHLNDKSMVTFTKDIGWCQYKKGERHIYIQKFAMAGKLQSTGIVDMRNEHPGMTCISVPNLMAPYDGVFFHVRIYQSKIDGSIRLFYLEDRAWEGNENYTISLVDSSKKRKRHDAPLLFDGSNGTLLDDEGNEIVCSMGSEATKYIFV